MSVLTKEEILRMGLVENASPDAFQPHGVDLRVDGIYHFDSYGEVYQDGKCLPMVCPISWEEWTAPVGDETEGAHLPPGPYLVSFVETVRLPDDIMAYLRPRSTLLRCGVALHTAVWDAGYHGRGQSLLVVYNKHGFEIERHSRIGQLVFHRLSSTTDGYSGSYQGEGLNEE